MAEVTDRDVSVVVQGPVGPGTREVVESVREAMPRAWMILSTWRGSEVDGLDVDEVVESEDPGSVPYTNASGGKTRRLFNTNRMLVSTKAGLARVDRDWCVKLRSDSPMVHAGVLDWLDRFPTRHPEMRVFGHRIVTASVATRPATTMPGMLFHPSDCVHVGAIEDVVALWDVDEIDEEENSEWFADRIRPRDDYPVWGVNRYYNEQVLWLGCLHKRGFDPGYDHTGAHRPDLVEVSDRSIVNNFLVLEPWQLGVRLPTLQPVVSNLPLWQYLWFEDWRRRYESLIPGSRS